MKKIILILTAFLSIAVSKSMAEVTVNDTILVLKNVNVLDVAKGKFIKRKSLTIMDGKIAAIGNSFKTDQPIKTIDFKGAFLMPGLIDVHVHVTSNFKNNIENTYSHLNYFLKHGITSVRDAGGDGDALLKASTAINAGEKSGPDVYYSSFMAGDWYYNRGQNIRKEPYTAWQQRLMPGDDLDKAMIWAKSVGVTGVKLYHSFDAQFLPLVTSAAKRNGLKVWGHTMLYPASPVDVVKSGMEVLSHVSMLETLRKPDTLFNRRTTTNTYRDSVVAGIDITEFCNEMKKHNAILDATLCVSVDRDPWVLKLLKRVHQQGVKIATGTDQIVDLKSPYPRLLDELNYFVNDCGFTNAEAIRSATLIAAEVIGQEKNIGSVEIGKRANLIVLKENPLKDIAALKDIEVVIKAGKLQTN
ncbi:amidohydrolase family protein [Pedobacter xixiisoli]|uniref:Amidohydrolase family protein n=1 Tax=Pedobacter xixiisoli TaxID=1476464 RepID=A0A285ZZJ7_9SPHI|nr:amidohydrolase family protein [Pedobacter xixiisoli]SOD15070.1 Amidohydrolase family protein [Pedobacter xixiisoli]